MAVNADSSFSGGIPPGHPYGQLAGVLAPVYRASGYFAGACIAGIFAVTMLQVAGRLIGYNPAGLTAYASYLMAAAIFGGMAYAFDASSHIRIELFLSLSGRFKPIIERAGFAVSTVIAGWMCYHAWVMVYWSVTFGDLSEGMDATPLWIPQASMALGLTLFFIAVLDRSARLFAFGGHGLHAAPDAL